MSENIYTDEMSGEHYPVLFLDLVRRDIPRHLFQRTVRIAYPGWCRA